MARKSGVKLLASNISRDIVDASGVRAHFQQRRCMQIENYYRGNNNAFSREGSPFVFCGHTIGPVSE